MANTPRKSGADIQTSRVELGEDISTKGQMIAILTSDLEVYAAADTANYVVVGVNYGDDTGTVGDEGDTITVTRSVFRFDNTAGGNAVTQAYLTKVCYVGANSTTVSKDGGTNDIVAGTVVDVDSAGVWVDVGRNTSPVEST